MRFLKCLLVLLAILVSTACTTTQQMSHAQTALISSLEDQTLALVRLDPLHDEDEPEHRVVCTAVWVAPHTFLTAAHCTEEDSKTLLYFTHAESNGAFKEPKKFHEATVVKLDAAHDLALAVSGSDDPGHGIATVALTSPPVGDDLHLIGHVIGLSWTYVRGVVAAYRGTDFGTGLGGDTLGPFMQVSGPVYKGNSGGGAFDRYGELVGIADFIMKSPNTAFYVHLTTIREFLRNTP